VRLLAKGHFVLSACSLGLSTTSQQYFSLRMNQPSTTSRNQPAVLFSQNKPAPAISHQPTEQVESRQFAPPQGQKYGHQFTKKVPPHRKHTRSESISHAFKFQHKYPAGRLVMSSRKEQSMLGQSLRDRAVNRSSLVQARAFPEKGNLVQF
jgi:hypothetical protein